MLRLLIVYLSLFLAKPIPVFAEDADFNIQVGETEISVEQFPASGKTLFSRNRAAPGRVVARPYVGAMNDMMATTSTQATGKAAAASSHAATRTSRPFTSTGTSRSGS